jgi:uncharacterized protein (TIGR02145 family)
LEFYTNMSLNLIHTNKAGIKLSGGRESFYRDTRDGYLYPTIKIGNQWWMAENLKYLPVVHNNSDFATEGAAGNPAYGVYDYDGSVVADAKALARYQEYGVLYNWHAAMEAAPAGWRLPEDAEIKELEMYLGMTEANANATGWRSTGNVGSKLKSRYQVNSPLGAPWARTTHPRWNENAIYYGTDDWGFSALPGGYRGTGGSFNDVGTYGYWWSASPDGTGAWRRALVSGGSSVYRSTVSQAYGFSVRCIKT